MKLYKQPRTTLITPPKSKGAIGAVMMNWGGPENPAVPMGSVKPNWGSPTPEGMRDEMPTIPCIGIARVDGLRLKAEGEKAPVEIWMRPVVENGWRPVQITVGEVTAPETSPEAEDFVLIGGHQDSWPGEAATDNAAGNACMLELARVMNENRDKLRYLYGPDGYVRADSAAYGGVRDMARRYGLLE